MMDKRIRKKLYDIFPVLIFERASRLWKGPDGRSHRACFGDVQLPSSQSSTSSSAPNVDFRMTWGLSSKVTISQSIP